MALTLLKVRPKFNRSPNLHGLSSDHHQMSLLHTCFPSHIKHSCQTTRWRLAAVSQECVFHLNHGAFRTWSRVTGQGQNWEAWPGELWWADLHVELFAELHQIWVEWECGEKEDHMLLQESLSLSLSSQFGRCGWLFISGTNTIWLCDSFSDKWNDFAL